MKIAIIGLGCVAMADALALARTHQVVMTGPVPDRVDAINRGEFDLPDPHLASYLATHSLDLQAVLNTSQALALADMVFISMPLSQDGAGNIASLVELDTRIEYAMQRLPHAPIVVRSAVPVGYCEAKRIALRGAKIVYAPEFCRKGHMLSDVLYPDFLIVGDEHALGQRVLDTLKTAAMRSNIPTRQMGLTEAELARQRSGMGHAPLSARFLEYAKRDVHHGPPAWPSITGLGLDPIVGAPELA